MWALLFWAILGSSEKCLAVLINQLHQVVPHCFGLFAGRVSDANDLGVSQRYVASLVQTDTETRYPAEPRQLGLRDS